ncbi:hypothetical protein BsWGS_08187 [Bradybaena similaris]
MQRFCIIAFIHLWSFQCSSKSRGILAFSTELSNNQDEPDEKYDFQLGKGEYRRDNAQDTYDPLEHQDPGQLYDAGSTYDWYDIDDDVSNTSVSEVADRDLDGYDPISDSVVHNGEHLSYLNNGEDEDYDLYGDGEHFKTKAQISDHFSSNSVDTAVSEAAVRHFGNSFNHVPGIACPEKCACGATKVDCAGQNLTSVPEGISNLTTWLDLSMNSLQKLPEDTFVNMVNIKELRCVGNNLTELPDGLFRRNKNLQLLNFQGNLFATVPPKAFQDLSLLLELHLDANLITSIPPNAFVGLTSLKQLWLDDNRLDRIPVQALGQLTGLQALTLIKNHIVDIPNFAFQNNSRLIQLRLANNEIKDIAEHALYGLTQLKYLQLQNNRIRTMPSAISHLVSLDELNLEGNRLTEIPENSFQSKDKLTMLILGNNPITRVSDEAFINLPALQELRLSEVHDMTQFPDLTGTMNLTVLQLDRANIKSIPKEICAFLRKLKTFDVHSNKIGVIPEMSQCKSLTILNMANNELTSIDGQLFNGMDHLKDLTLSINYIHSIPEDAFIGLGALEYLNLAENQISEIHAQAFLPLKSLKDLNLGYNKIHHLPTAGLVSLEKLKVFHNPDLREFPPKQEFPNVNNFVLTYAYHCCDFILSKPEQIYLDMIREHVVWMEAGEPGQMAMWAKYENESRLWESLIENTTMENELWGRFVRNDYDLLTSDRLSPVASTYLEDYQSQAYDHNYVIAKAAISCKPKPGPFMPCDDLFGWWSLRCGVWFVFMLAVLGNGVVFFVSVTSKSKMDVPRFLICNLALADFLMGIYLGILAIIDASTLGQFKKYAIQWQMSAGCLVAGTLGVLSSELSVFTLTVITLERFYAITHAMQLSKRLSLKHAGIIMLCGWIWSFGLAILPLFGISDYRKFAVCLPFEIESVLSKSYVCFIMVFNGMSFFIILSCYLIMYVSIKDSQAWNSNDTRVAKRMALLVFTDFLCWAPIAFLSLAAAFGKNLIHLNEAKVLTIFILPLNSCANPFLYAFFTKQFKKDCVLLCRRLEDSSIAKHFSQVSQRHGSLSWKHQRRPSALHSLMGGNKSNNSQNNSSGSHSFGLINCNSEISSRGNVAPEDDAFTTGKDVHAAKNTYSVNNCVAVTNNNRLSHRYTHKYKPCPTGAIDDEYDDDRVKYMKTAFEDVTTNDDIHVILHQDFCSQKGAGINGCTVETYLNEEKRSLFVIPTQTFGDNFSTDCVNCRRNENRLCPSIIIHPDDSAPLDESSIWIRRYKTETEFQGKQQHEVNDETYRNIEHCEAVTCVENQKNNRVLDVNAVNETEKENAEKCVILINSSKIVDCDVNSLQAPSNITMNGIHKKHNESKETASVAVNDTNKLNELNEKCLPNGTLLI